MTHPVKCNDTELKELIVLGMHYCNDTPNSLVCVKNLVSDRISFVIYHWILRTYVFMNLLSLVSPMTDEKKGRQVNIPKSLVVYVSVYLDRTLETE